MRTVGIPGYKSVVSPVVGASRANVIESSDRSSLRTKPSTAV